MKFLNFVYYNCDLKNKFLLLYVIDLYIYVGNKYQRNKIYFKDVGVSI